MKRLLHTTSALVFLASLTALATACDHQEGGPLGPLDVVEDTDDGGDGVVEHTNAYVAPVDLELDHALGNQLVPAGQASELLARIRVEAPDELDLPRPAARVVLVVDTSASMRGDAIQHAKQAAEALVDTLADGDSFALVVFHSEAAVMMPMTVIGDDSRAAAKAQIEKMQAWGTTDLAGGLQLALQQLGQNSVAIQPDGSVAVGAGISAAASPDPMVLQRVVLLGDGVPNDPTPIPGLAQQFAARGAEVTALGYGLEYDETLMAQLAQTTHGGFRFVDEDEAVAAVFRDEVLHIQRTVARDLRLSFGLGPGVSLIEVVGHTVQWNQSTHEHELVLGSIAEGQSLEFIVRLGVGPHSEGATVELSDLGLAFTDVHTGTGARFEHAFLSATASADSQAIEAGENRDIARVGARARTNAATLAVLQLARAGQTKEAKKALRAAVEWAEATAVRLEDEDLAKQAEDLAALGPELAALAPRVHPSGGQAQGAAGPASGWGGEGIGGIDGVDQSFAPAPPPSTPQGALKVKSAHSAAYNELNN